ncbi:MAG TPA: hypothetical protein DD641_03680, partial [Deltaproteobacteria bacterium]|nr:hypothetical protein [Deltaproteobacteria bacterium]
MGLSFSLKKSFPGHKTEVELSIGEEVIVLFGPSGAGKSLILKLISGIIKPDEGLVAVDSEKLFDSRNNIDIPIRLRKIGYLFQDYALFPHMTVYENIAYGITNLSVPLARQTGMKGMGIGQKVRELMELMRLEGLENRYPNELSGGQKQRTALARTLAAEPRILLLDEPFSALDYQVREKLRGDILNIHKVYPITTIFVTHDIEEAFMLGKKIAVVNHGRVEQFGTREDVFYRPKTKNVAKFIG